MTTLRAVHVFFSYTLATFSGLLNQLTASRWVAFPILRSQTGMQPLRVEHNIAQDFVTREGPWGWRRVGSSPKVRLISSRAFRITWD